MAKKTAPLLATTADLLSQFGDRLRLARLRRGLSAQQVAQRAGMAPMTLRSLERGGSGVTMGAYLSVMQVLGIEDDLNWLGKADPIGRQLQDAKLPTRNRTARPPAGTSSAPLHAEVDPLNTLGREVNAVLITSDDVRDWVKTSDFPSSEELASLIDAAVSPKKKVR